MEKSHLEVESLIKSSCERKIVGAEVFYGLIFQFTRETFCDYDLAAKNALFQFQMSFDNNH